MAANINPETGIPYGIISARKCMELVNTMQMWGEDIRYKECLEEHLRSVALDYEDSEKIWDEDAIQRETESFSENYECDEPIHSYTDSKGNEFQTTWLGGALMVWVFKSSKIVQAAQCSPCVPNCGDLDNPGSYECYGMPDEYLE